MHYPALEARRAAELIDGKRRKLALKASRLKNCVGARDIRVQATRLSIWRRDGASEDLRVG
eukprot:5222122-Pleurochrysis_carterae.AAC.1